MSIKNAPAAIRHSKLKLWLLRPNPKIIGKFGSALLRDAALGLLNDADMGRFEYSYKKERHIMNISDVLLPNNFPMVRFSMPENKFAPDYIPQASYHFSSARLKEALGQPDDVVQFHPIDLVRGGPAARAQDYRQMRVIARQSAMDLNQSTCRVEEITSRVTGESIAVAGNISQIVFLPDFQPKFDMFRIDEAPTYILVKDEIAARVIEAGCTGIEFRDPLDNTWGKHIKHIRTATGVMERRFGF